VTYSVVGRDPESGRLGLAIASCVLAVGRAAFARPGSGVAAVQARGSAAEGERALDLLAHGEPAGVVVRRLRRRAASVGMQFGVLDAEGRVAAHTGAQCSPHAGHVTGDGVTVQGNLLLNADLPQVVLAAWDGAEGQPLEERLVGALQAGDQHGGDLRGRQSAALLTVPGPDDPAGEPVLLRVDDHGDPLAELGRLLVLYRAHEQLRAGWTAAATEPEIAADHLRRARRLAPADGLVAQTAALVLAHVGDESGARSAMRVARRTLPDPAEWLRRRSAEAPWAVAGGTGPSRPDR
jgi:uncharacterized Ntn-hydrolase superfamily protein